MSDKLAEKTKVIRVFETFAGIGAQHKALTNIDKEQKYFKVVKTSEWDARAVIAYSQIHNKDIFDKELKKIKKMKEEEVNKFFKDKVFSLNSKTPGNILRKDLNFRQNLMAASIVNNNFPDIRKVSGEQLRNVDLLTYSFPCQGLSIANMGRDKGIKQSVNSTSNLIWQIKRILDEAKNKNIKLPKYLVMENVQNLLGKKHIKDYESWKKILKKSFGYTTKTLRLNGLNHRSIQKRTRVFGISIINWNNDIKDMEFEKKFLDSFLDVLKVSERREIYKRILNSSKNKIDEINEAIPNNTTSRIRMLKENNDLLDTNLNKRSGWIFRTLTTKQDRHPNIGMIKINSNNEKKLSGRFITTREAYQIMGFSSEDFSKVKIKYKEGIITKEALYRQAGNSIIVTVLEDVFNFIKKMEVTSV